MPLSLRMLVISLTYLILFFSCTHSSGMMIQQLSQVLFTTEKRDRIILEAHKLVPGTNGEPIVDPAIIDIIWPD